MSDRFIALIDLFNSEAEALGLPLARADLPLSDQKPNILLTIGEECLRPENSVNMLRMRKAFAAFLKAELIQEALEGTVKTPTQTMIGSKFP